MENAAANGADAIACACPLCMLNLDMREAEINAARAKEGLPPLDIPIYYFTELLAASMGAPASKSGINRHFHPAGNLHERALAVWNKQRAAEKEAEEAAKSVKETQRKARAATRAAKAKSGTKPEANATKEVIA